MYMRMYASLFRQIHQCIICLLSCKVAAKRLFLSVIQRHLFLPKSFKEAIVETSPGSYYENLCAL